MFELSKLQHEFMQHLLDKDSVIAQNVTQQGQVPVSTRLGIYGNAYKVRLKGSIENDHEMLGIYLGDELFDLLAAGYIESKPSHYTSLRDFCQHLPEYLRTTAPFSDHPIIAEIADFERLLLIAFDAGNAQRATIEELTAIPQEQWPDLTLRFHPSLQIYTTDWNSVPSWQALKAEKSPPQQEELKAQWLIWRNRDRITEFRSLANDEHAMLSGFLQGSNFAEICEELLEFHVEEEVASHAIQHLTSWLKIGIISSFQ
ncbi:MAG: DUF2063 domain-containing protein [Gammaproteobacteria bacterium]|nr:MAG: DUF2063 domain-containing protein [Gammaproteobacteria bacterium]